MTSPSIDPKSFRKALGSFTTGVTVVTTRGADGRDTGLTANSFNSVSLDPPLVLWSLDRISSSAAAFMTAEHFAVHILASDQENLSNQFARSGVDRFAGLAPARGLGDVPLIDGCSARFECRALYRYEGGDHVIFVGEVLSFESFSRSPLVFHGGNYGLLIKKQAAETAAAGSSFGDDWLGFLLARAYYQMLAPLRTNVQRHGLDDVHYNILSVLSMGDGRSIGELSGLIEITGHQVRKEHFIDLVMRGWIVLEHGERVRFTEDGRRYAIELIAAGKSAETDAANALEYDELRLLKMLLKRIIHTTGSGIPGHWRRENFWLDNNMWKNRSRSGSGEKPF